jgi:hypothetical protein
MSDGMALLPGMWACDGCGHPMAGMVSGHMSADGKRYCSRSCLRGAEAEKKVCEPQLYECELCGNTVNRKRPGTRGRQSMFCSHECRYTFFNLLAMFRRERNSMRVEDFNRYRDKARAGGPGGSDGIR